MSSVWVLVNHKIFEFFGYLFQVSHQNLSAEELSGHAEAQAKLLAARRPTRCALILVFVAFVWDTLCVIDAAFPLVWAGLHEVTTHCIHS